MPSSLPRSNDWPRESLAMDTTNLDTTKTSDAVDHRRRCFLGTAALTAAAVQLGLVRVGDLANAQSTTPKVRAIKPGTNTSFVPLNQIDAGFLNVGYAEAGPANGP